MNFKYENKKIKEGYNFVIGCDEVGRGCLAGPVVAAAVVLDVNGRPSDFKDIKDSKLLSAKKREELSKVIKKNALAWSIGEVSSEVVDKINIHNASLLAMRRAVEKILKATPDGGIDKAYLYIDGKFIIPDFHMKQEAIVGGDNKVLSVAAASIVAKVYRDDLMQKLHKKYPVYNFAQHKGYATFHHRQMILRHGLSKIHRTSFCSHLV